MTDTTEPTVSTIKRFQCRHIHTTGRRCGSPALRGVPFCYHHHTTRRPAPRHRGVHPAQSIFEMPAIDDRAGIQFALAQILNRLTTGQLDPKRANPILYTLKLAIWNLHETRPAARTAARTAASNDSRDSRSPDDSNVNDPDDLVEDLILDPDLGPIAPIAEIPTPEAAAAAAHAAAQARAAKAAAAHAANRAAAAEAIHSAFALFQQENGFPSEPPDPTPIPATLPSLQACIASSYTTAPKPALGQSKDLDVETWVRRAHLQSTPAIQSVRIGLIGADR